MGFDCISGNCVDRGSGVGQYSTLSLCESRRTLVTPAQPGQCTTLYRVFIGRCRQVISPGNERIGIPGGVNYTSGNYGVVTSQQGAILGVDLGCFASNRPSYRIRRANGTSYTSLFGGLFDCSVSSNLSWVETPYYERQDGQPDNCGAVYACPTCAANETRVDCPREIDGFCCYPNATAAAQCARLE